jgi:ABC-2 type transport system ATP-binding protein
MEIVDELRAKPGVEMVAPFGNTLHVSGTDHAALERAVNESAKRPGLEIRKVDPTLEDVFIHLMRDVGEAARPGTRQAH